MNYIPNISKKLKFGFILSMLFTLMVSIAIFLNFRETSIDANKESTSLKYLLSLEDALLKIEQLESSNLLFKKNTDTIIFNTYVKNLQNITDRLLLNYKTNEKLVTREVEIEKLQNAISSIITHEKTVLATNKINGINEGDFYKNQLVSQNLSSNLIIQIIALQKFEREYLSSIDADRDDDFKKATWLFLCLIVMIGISLFIGYLILRKDYIKSKGLNKIVTFNSTLLLNISDAIITTDENFLITDWNNHAAELYGFSKEEVLGKTTLQVLRIDLDTANPDSLPANFIKNGLFKGEAIHFHKNNNPINVQVSKSVIKNKQNEIVGSIAIVRDITKSVKLNTELQNLTLNLQEQVKVKVAELNFFFERVQDVFIALDYDWNYTYANKEAIKVYGIDKPTLIGQNIWEVYPLLKNTPYYYALLEAKNTQKVQNIELNYQGDNMWYEGFIYPGLSGVSVYFRNITEKKIADIELNKALERLNFHFKNTPLAIIEFDSDMRIIQWSKNAEVLFEYKENEVIGTDFKLQNTIYPDDLSHVFESLLSLASTTGISNIINNRNITKSGKTIYCEWHNSVLKDEKNNITGMLSLVKDVTNDKLVQAELVNAELKYRSLVEQSVVGVYIRNSEKFIYVNPRFAEIFGYTEQELYDLDPIKLVSEEDLPKVERIVTAYKDSGKLNQQYQFKGIRKDGNFMHGEIYGKLTMFNNSPVVMGTIVDITEKKLAAEQLKTSQEALKLSSDRFELVAKATNDAVWDWDMKTDTLWGNESFYKLFEVPEHTKLKYEDFIKRIKEDEQVKIMNNFKNTLSQKSSVLTEEFHFLDANGNFKIIFDRAYILYDENKRAYRMLGAMQDVTAIRESEQKIILEKELSDSVINSLPGIFYLYTKEGKYLRWNKNLETIFGYSSEEIAAMHPLQFFPESEHTILIEKIGSVFLKGSDDVEANLITKSGDEILYHCNGMVIKYEGQDCLMGIGIDISDKIKAQKELSKSEEKFRTLVQQASDGIMLSDDKGNFIEVNESAALLTGYTQNELLGMNLNDIFGEIGSVKKSFRYNELLTGTVIISERILKRKSGRLVQVEVSAKQLTGGRFQGIIRDITERKLTDEALKISEKKYRVLFDENPLPLWILSTPDNKFLDVNKAATVAYGYTKEEFLKMKVADLKPVNELHINTNYLPNLFNDAGSDILVNHQKKYGEIIKVNVISHNITYEGKPAILSLANNVTARYDAEKKLQESHEALRDLASHVEAAREAERTRIAREIHDELGQQLTGLKMDISWINKKLNTNDEPIKEKITETIQLIDNAVITVRRIATQLRPSILDDLGLIAAMEWQSDEFERRALIKSLFKSNVSNIEVSPEIATGLFRIFQESLTNVARHSQATAVTTNLKQIDENIVLTINDNGIGFDEEKIGNKKTLGLLGMKERVLLINGTYIINGNSGSGTSVIITVPLN